MKKKQREWTGQVIALPNNITLPEFFLSRIVKISDLFIIRSAVKNWIEIVLFRAGLKNKITIHFRTRGSLRIRNKDDYFKFIHVNKDWALELARQQYPRIKIGKGVVRINAFGRENLLWFKTTAELGNAVGLGIEEFVWQEYAWLDVQGKQVLDIGANIGDTALYFAVKGARHVYAIEPFYKAYTAARRNVSINRLESRITLLNAAVAGKDGHADVSDKGEIGNLITLDGIISKKGRRIRLISLKRLVEIYKIKDGALKIDIEGGEYAIILNSSMKVLRSFSQIQLEYHHGYIDLKKKLEHAGFKVRHTMPRYSGFDDTVNPIRYDGLLFAERIGRTQLGLHG